MLKKILLASALAFGFMGSFSAGHAQPGTTNAKDPYCDNNCGRNGCPPCTIQRP
jgi:hypothetical protein